MFRCKEFILLCCVVFLFSCQRNYPFRKVLDEAERLSTSMPDSSYYLLGQIKKKYILKDNDLARWCLIAANTNDMLDKPMPPASELNRTYQWCKKHSGKDGKAWAGLFLGRAFMEEKKYDLAMKVFIESLDKAEKDGAYNEAGYICSYMGDFYEHTEQRKEEIRIRNKATRYFKKAGNKKSYALSLRDAARPWIQLDSLMNAYRLLKEADRLITAEKDTIGIASVASRFGDYYSKIGNADSAKYYYYRAIRLDTTEMAPSFVALGNLYLNMGQVDSARLYAMKADRKSVDLYTPLNRIYLLYKIEKADNHTDKALEWLEKYKIVEDEVYNEEQEINVINAEKQYNNILLVNDNQRLKINVLVSLVMFLLALVASMTGFLFYQKKDRQRISKINSQQLLLDKKENELCLLNKKLLQAVNAGKDLNHLKDRAVSLREEISRKQQEISELKRDKLWSTSVARKMKRMLSHFYKKEHDLTAADWVEIKESVDLIYGALDCRLEKFGNIFTDADLQVIYLSFYNLNRKDESIILNIQTDSVNKRRTRVRQKLGVKGDEGSISEYLLSCS